ncbi:unnamed protein product [Strongylus vulgaris]|uniref:Laminin domain-containing protein n=1 Tax=Strongylus vulgaris TaxID=40348 RepID=A0A3P7I703_STRVU|nr:unnamed protein product [Strongylus vulgaris]
MKDAEETLSNLEVVTADGTPKQATNVSATVQALQEKLKERSDKVGELEEKIEETKKKNEKVSNYLSDAQHLLRESRKNAEDSRKAVSGLSTMKLEGLIKALSDGREKAVDDHRMVKNLTEQAKDSREAIGNSMASIAEIRAELAEATETKRSKRATPFDKASINVKLGELESEANRLNETFGSTRLESQNAVEAASAYANITESLKTAREKSQWIIDEMANLKDGLEENNEDVKTALNQSAVLLRQTSDLQQNTLNSLRKEVEDMDKKIERVSTAVDGMRRNLEFMRTSLKSPLNESAFADVEKSADHVNSLLVDSAKVNIHPFTPMQLNKGRMLNISRDQIAELKTATDAAVSEATEALQGIKTTRSNVKELSTLVPNLLNSYDKMRYSAGNRSAKVEACNDKLVSIKELIAVARDAANRIKLGAHFEKGSSLDLAMPQKVAKSAAHTDISFHFRTDKDHGQSFSFFIN